MCDSNCMLPVVVGHAAIILLYRHSKSAQLFKFKARRKIIRSETRNKNWKNNQKGRKDGLWLTLLARIDAHCGWLIELHEESLKFGKDRGVWIPDNALSLICYIWEHKSCYPAQSTQLHDLPCSQKFEVISFNCLFNLKYRTTRYPMDNLKMLFVIKTENSGFFKQRS